MSYNLHIGDCLKVLPTLEANSVDSIVTDPPYGFKFMGKKWDYDVPSVDTWKECLRVLKPGGHLLSFGGTRTFHRLVVNIEDAGFEIRDTISWIYGSGFPKSLDISKKIDKLKGAERERNVIPDKRSKLHGDRSWMNDPDHRFESNEPITDEAKQWSGFGTALKPAMELICMARKPISEKNIASNVLLHGTGGLNINQSRVNTMPRKTGTKPDNDIPTGTGNTLTGSSKNRQAEYDNTTKGRWPANVIHDGSDEVTRLFPNTGISSGGSGEKSQNPNYDGNTVGSYLNGIRANMGGLGDSGSAARFFYCAKASKEDRDEGLRGFAEKLEHDGRYNKKPFRIDSLNPKPAKNSHPTIKPTALCRYLVKLVTPPGGVVLDPFMGSGSTGKACMLEGFKFVGIEMEEEYYKIAEARIKSAQNKGHQTTIF